MTKLFIGIDIGGTRTKIGLVDLGLGAVIDTLICNTEKENEDLFLEGIDNAIARFKVFAGQHNVSIGGIGFGIPGFVYQNGMVDSTYGFLKFMEDYPLKELIEARYGLPCLADNDARVVALGEALYGAGVGFDRVLVLTLGTGLGLGFTINGQLNEPLSYGHMAGHLSVDRHGIDCYCGKKGCLEALVSATGLLAAAHKMGWENKYPSELPLSAESLFQARLAGNPDADFLIGELISNLKTGIDNYINIYAPDLIVLGGGLSKGLKQDIDRLHDAALLNPFKAYQAALTTSQLNEDAGILGAAALFNSSKKTD